MYFLNFLFCILVFSNEIRFFCEVKDDQISGWDCSSYKHIKWFQFMATFLLLDKYH